MEKEERGAANLTGRSNWCLLVEGLVPRIADVEGCDVLILSQIDGGDGFWRGLLTWSELWARGDRELAFSAHRRAGRTAFLFAVGFGLAQLSTVILLQNTSTLL
jgi:hypothetical protein